MANEYDGKDLAALSDEQLEELIKNDKKKDDFIKIMNYIKDNNVEDSIFLLYQWIIMKVLINKLNNIFIFYKNK